MNKRISIYIQNTHVKNYIPTHCPVLYKTIINSFHYNFYSSHILEIGKIGLSIRKCIDIEVDASESSCHLLTVTGK